MVGIGRGVPAPIRHGGEGDAFFVKIGKGLQPGYVNGVGEISVAHGKGA